MVWSVGVKGVVKFQCLGWRQRFCWEMLFVIIKLVIRCDFFMGVKAWAFFLIV